ncbi:hypothetical protein FISHEDRAFT_7193, partial [Fistulina hepatica ATCC 64428]
DQIRTSSYLNKYFANRSKAALLAQEIATTSFPEDVYHVLSSAHDFGCVFKQTAYENVCHQLSVAHKWNLITAIVDLGIRHTGSTSLRLLNWRARALIETQRFAPLQTYLDEFTTHRILPDRRTFHLLITGHIRNHDLRHAAFYLRLMEQHGYPATPETHGLITSFYRSLGSEPGIEAAAIEHLPHMSKHTGTAVLNALIQYRLDAHDYTRARRLLSLFRRDHVVSIAEALDVGGASEDYVIPGSHIVLYPNADTFTIFLNLMAVRKNLAGALSILRGMIASSVRPEACTVTSLVHVLFSTGHNAAALHLIQGICNSSSQSWFAELNRLAPLGPRHLGLPVDISLGDTKIVLGLQTFNAFLRGMVKTSGLIAVAPVIQIMLAHNCRPNDATLEIVLRHLERSSASPNMLLRVLSNMCVTDVRPTLRHVHVVLQAVLRREKFLQCGSSCLPPPSNENRTHLDTARRIAVTDPAIPGLDPVQPTAGLVGQRDFPGGQPHRRALRWALASISARGVRMDMALLASRMRHEAVGQGSVRRVNALFQELLRLGMHPTEYHIAALMEGHALAGDMATAWRTMERSAVEFGVRPNVVLYTILISGHARAGEAERALQTFEEMVETGVRPDVPAIDAVVGAFTMKGSRDFARGLLRSLWHYIEPFPQKLERAGVSVLVRRFRA